MNACDLSVIIPALNEGPNLEALLPELHRLLRELHITYEILVVTTKTDQATIEAAARCGAVAITQEKPGYGGALQQGFETACGHYILTMDADLSHPPAFVHDMWRTRQNADVTIASRYVASGRAAMPASRYILSRILNVFFGRGLSLSVRDMSSGFRLYKANVLKGLSLEATRFNILQEILVKVYAEGWKVHEIPFQYAARQHGSSHARVLPFGIAYLKTFWSLWKLRNSILAADYDDRAYDSPIPMQRYWQRRRFHHITSLVAGEGAILDVGCGSSRIISQLAPGSVALDVLYRKLRYARKFGKWLVHGSGLRLPFPDESFPCVLCSQVIEHVPKDSPILEELCRVLKPDGRLVLGTPDYANWEWIVTERLYAIFAPGAYADEHISHYTRLELIDYFQRRGFLLEDTRYILRGELILAFRKAARSRT
jgi:dolichol-phosphate mannosyltransferase